MDLITSAMNGLVHGPRHVYRTLKRTLFGKSLCGKVSSESIHTSVGYKGARPDDPITLLWNQQKN